LQASKPASKQEMQKFGTSMPNFSQIGSEMAILAHFKQATMQESKKTSKRERMKASYLERPCQI